MQLCQSFFASHQRVFFHHPFWKRFFRPLFNLSNRQANQTHDLAGRKSFDFGIKRNQSILHFLIGLDVANVRMMEFQATAILGHFPHDTHFFACSETLEISFVRNAEILAVNLPRCIPQQDIIHLARGASHIDSVSGYDAGFDTDNVVRAK
ncbi:hypothetical protein D3C72_1534580 [compost metagenome]